MSEKGKSCEIDDMDERHFCLLLCQLVRKSQHVFIFSVWSYITLKYTVREIFLLGCKLWIVMAKFCMSMKQENLMGIGSKLSSNMIISQNFRSKSDLKTHSHTKLNIHVLNYIYALCWLKYFSPHNFVYNWNPLWCWKQTILQFIAALSSTLFHGFAHNAPK